MWFNYARGCLIDGLPFQILTSLKIVLSDGIQCRLETSGPTKLNIKQQNISSPTLQPQTKFYVALSQKLNRRRQILFHRQTRRPEIAPACRTYWLRGLPIWM
ncbi:hypothetical protein NGI46_29645, partial [Peribacillus butanolivorans]|nr:hypothetical protein [Peribacillus butanolivorans]